MRPSFLIVQVLFFTALVVPAFAADTLSALQTDKPIEITSRQLEVFQNEQKTVFSGDVVAIQDDFELRADRLVVLFVAGQNQLERLEATGGVEIVQAAGTAHADKAVFDQQDQVLILTGSAVLEQGENRIAGDEIHFLLKENRSFVKSSDNGRVKAIIIPQQKQDK